MKDLGQYISETIFDKTGLDDIMKFKIGFSNAMPKRFDVNEWVAFWIAIRDNFSILTSAMKRGQLQNNLWLLDVIKIMLIDPKYYPFESRPSYEIRLMKNEKKFGGEEWAQKFESYNRDIHKDRLVRLQFPSCGGLWYDAFVPMEHALNSIDAISIRNQYEAKINKLIEDYLKTLQQ